MLKRVVLLIAIVVFAASAADAQIKMKFKKDPKLDLLTVKACVVPTTSVDPEIEDVSVQLHNVTGVPFDQTLDAGSFLPNAELNSWKYKADRDGTPKILKLIIKEEIDKATSVLLFKVDISLEADFSTANPDENMSNTEQELADMSVQFNIGDDAFITDTTWERTRNGWQLTPPRASMRFKADPKLDFATGKWVVVPLTPVDPGTETVTLQLSNVAGTLFSESFAAGTLIPNGKGTKWTYKAPRDGTEKVYSLSIQKKLNAYHVKPKLDADLSDANPEENMAFTAAQLADITIQLDIGDDTLTLDRAWERTGSGWRLKDIEIPPQ